MLTILVIGGLCVTVIPIDILPVFKRPAVQVLTFYAGMPATAVEKDITNRLERWTGPGRQYEPAGIPLHRRRQRRAELFSNLRRPQRGAGPGDVAGDRNAPHPSAGNASAGGAAV